MSRAEPLLEVRDLTKHYGTIEALTDAHLTVDAGEIVAIVGDNGAGKSTLIKIISGATHPDRGEIRVDGRPLRFSGPSDARQVGIDTVYQDLALLPNLDVATNLFLGRERRAQGLKALLRILDRRGMREEAETLLGELGIALPSINAMVGDLSGGQRQSVAIARAAAFARRLLIMDEPTAALGVAQSEAVLALAERVRDRGIAVIIISHILPNVLRTADRVVVLRHGRVAADLPRAEVTQDRLIRLIVGFDEGDSTNHPDTALDP